MNNNTINICLVAVFLLANFIIGIRASKGVNTMRDYVIGNGSFGVIALVLTLLASDIGGTAILYGTQFLFSDGLASAFAESLPIVLCLVIAYIIAPRLMKLSECLTIGDIMKSFYGKYIGVATGLFGFIHSVCIAGMEFLILKKISNSLLNIDSIWFILIVGLTLAISTAIGGIKSITTGDVFKFIIMAIGIPMMAYSLSNKVGGIVGIFEKVPVEKLEIFSNKDFIRELPNTLLFSILPFCFTCPFVVQRILMARHKNDIKNMFILYGFSYPILNATLMIIAFSILILCPTIPADQVFIYGINNLLPNGLQWVAIVAIISIVISSIDSYLQIAGVTIIHDVLLPLLKREKQKSINELKWCRISTFLISFIAIIIGIKAQNAIELLVDTFSFTAPITLFPIISGLIGTKVDTKSYFYAAAATLVAYLYTTFFLPAEYSNFVLLIHLAANGIVFFGSLMIQNGGKVVFREEYRNTNPNLKKANLKERFTKIFSFPLHIAEYSRNKVDKYGAPYVLFAAFCLISYVLPFFLWTSGESHYNTEVLWIRFIGGILLCLLLVKEKWPRFLEPYLPLFWHFVLVYTLAFTNTVMFFATHGSIEWLINIALSIIFLIALVDWISFFIIASLGIGVGFIVFYYLIGGGVVLNLNFETKYLLFYQLLFGTIIGLLFAKRKQLKTSELEKTVDSTTEQYELTTKKLNDKEFGPIRIAQSIGKRNFSLLSTIDKLRDAIEDGEEYMTEEYLDILESNILSIIDEERFLKLDAKDIPIRELAAHIESNCIAKFSKTVSIKLQTSFTTIVCDKLVVSRIISQAMEDMKEDLKLFAKNFDAIPTLTVEISDTKLDYRLNYLKEYSKITNAIQITVSSTESIDKSVFKKQYIRELVDAYSIPINTEDITTERVATEKYLNAQYGLYENASSREEIIKVYVLPQDLYEIRPRGLDIYKRAKNAISFWHKALDQELLLKRDIELKAPIVKWENIQKALNFSRLYYDQKHLNASGEPYHIHTIAVTRILLEIITKYLSQIKYPSKVKEAFKPEDSNFRVIREIDNPLIKVYRDFTQRQEAIIVATLLHYTLEEAANNPVIIETMFGYEVAIYVLGITRLNYTEIANKKLAATVRTETTEENWLGILSYQDAIPFCIKVADRLQSLYAIDGDKNEDNRRRLAQETLEFFITPTENLGFNAIAKDFKCASDYILKHGKIEGFKFESGVLDFLNKKY
jgi:Na+/proline symporter